MATRVDIISGLPMSSTENAKEARKAEEEKRLENLRTKGVEVENRLSSEEGQYFVGLIINLLQTRIDQLVGGDVQCQAILNVLRGLGHDIAAGRAAADRLTKTVLRIEE